MEELKPRIQTVMGEKKKYIEEKNLNEDILLWGGIRSVVGRHVCNHVPNMMTYFFFS